MAVALGEMARGHKKTMSKAAILQRCNAAKASAKARWIAKKLPAQVPVVQQS